MPLFFALIAVACVFVARCRTALSYDGAWYLYKILDQQAPYTPDHRYVNVLWHWPVVFASHFTSSTAKLAMLFSAIYSGATLLSLIACWWIVGREHRHLFVWAALGICIGLLPGWIFMAGESMIAIPLFWPLLMGVLTGMERRAVPVVALASVALFVAHPVGIVYFGAVSVLALIIARWSDADRPRLRAWAAAFAALTVAKAASFIVMRSAYESGELTVWTQLSHFRASATGAPAIAVALTTAAGLLVAVRAVRATPPGTLRNALHTGLVGAGGVLLLLWAHDPARWRFAVDFRDLAVFSSAPFMAIAAWEAVRRIRVTPAEWTHRVALAQIAAIALLVVASVQGAEWSMLSSRLLRDVNEHNTACLSTRALPWIDESPLYHWSTPAYAVLLQGRVPSHLVLTGDGCSEPGFQDSVHIKDIGNHDEYRRRTGGWLDFSKAGLSARVP